MLLAILTEGRVFKTYTVLFSVGWTWLCNSVVDEPEFEFGEGERWFNLLRATRNSGIKGSKGIPLNLTEEVVEELVCVKESEVVTHT